MSTRVDTGTDEYDRYRLLLQAMERNTIDTNSPLARAYIDALVNGTEESMVLRLMVVGCHGVGKTSLARNLFRQPKTESKSTDGIDVHFCRASTSDIWSKQNGTAHDMEADRSANIIQQHASTNLKNKRNVQKSCLEETRILQKASKMLFLLEEMDNANVQRYVKIWDFGGQFVYYATHQLFHSQHAVYLLVLNASMKLEDVVKDDQYPKQKMERTVKDYCKFWMNSIQSYVGTTIGDSPPVILVATHIDAVKGGWNTEKESEFFEAVRNLFDGSILANHIQPETFAMSNTISNENEFHRLRKYISDVAKAQKFSKKLSQPASWIQLETAIMKHIGQRHISRDELLTLDLNNELPIKEKCEIRRFLKLHHSTGDLVYFDDGELSDTIIIDPQWIIDAFRCILTSEKRCLKLAKLRPKWKELVEEAKLSNDLIDAVWSDETNPDFLANKSTLLHYMSKLGILSKICEVDMETGTIQYRDFYMVPSLLHSHVPDNVLARILQSSTGTITTFVFAFDNQYVPPTLYHRITAAALGKWNVLVTNGTRLLFENIGVYDLDQVHSGVIELRDTTIEIRVMNRCKTNINCAMSGLLRRFVALVIQNEYRRSGVRHKNLFTEHIRCNIGNVTGDRTKQIGELVKCQYPSIPCPDNSADHIICSDDVLKEWQLDMDTDAPDAKKARMSESSTSANSKVQMNEREIQKISDAIGKNWQLLGFSLGFSTADIDKIELDHSHQSRLQICNMLRLWKQKAGEQATMKNLLSEMKLVKGLSVAWDKL